MGTKVNTMLSLAPAANPVGQMKVRQRPGGRSERVRRAVADAVLSYFRDGDVEFSVSDVASRAGVNRRTIYRWWPSRSDLVREGLSLHYAELEAPDTGDWSADIRALAEMFARYFSDPIIVGINALMASGRYPDLNAGVTDFWRPAIDALSIVVRRAGARGELKADVDGELVVQMLVSPLLVHSVLVRSKLSKTFVRRVADAVADLGRI